MKVAIQAKVLIKNAVLTKFIEEKGWTQLEFARQAGLDGHNISGIFFKQNMPTNQEVIDKIEAVTGIPIEEIFYEKPPQMPTSWRSKTRYIEPEILPFHQQKALEAPKVVDHTELNSVIEKLLEGLDERESDIIKMRFGIGTTNDRVLTLDEIGYLIGPSRTRIAQIEAKALRKLKHPAKRKLLDKFIE